MRRLFFLMIMQFVVAAVFSDNIDIILKELGVKREQCYFKLLKEEPVPYMPGTSICYVPVTYSSAEDSILGMSPKASVHMVLFNRDSLRITCRGYFKDEIDLNVLMPTGMRFDFAAFYLDAEKTKQAIGVRLIEHTRLSTRETISEYLTLYLPENGVFDKVIDKYPMSAMSKEWSEYGCDGESYEEKRIFVMSRSRADKYRDILVKIKTTFTRKVGEDNFTQHELDSLRADSSVTFSASSSMPEPEYDDVLELDSAAFAAEIAANDAALAKATKGMKSYGTVTAGSEIRVTQRKTTFIDRLFGERSEYKVKRVEIVKVDDVVSSEEDAGGKQVLSKKKESINCVEIKEEGEMMTGTVLRYRDGLYR